MPIAKPIVAALAALLLLWLGNRLYHALAARGAKRSSYFDALRALFDSCEMQVQPTGFPRLTGRSGGLAFDLQALPDGLTFRKLPALWVMVSLPIDLPVRATLDIMVRPSGAELFSRFSELPQALPLPAFLPEGAVLRTDNAALVPPEHLVARHAGILADPRVKELLISPKGLRIVMLAEEADRGRYLIFRDAEVGMTPLAAGRVAPLLESLRALRTDLLDWAKEQP